MRAGTIMASVFRPCISSLSLLRGASGDCECLLDVAGCKVACKIGFALDHIGYFWRDTVRICTISH